MGNTLLLTDGGLVDSITQDDIDYDELKNVCKRPLDWFFRRDAEHTITGKSGRHIYIQHENAKVLAVAHADTVINPRDKFNFNILNRKTDSGEVVRIVKTPTLDDRLGIYTIMNLLPSIFGAEWADILITEGEESGNSTAQDFVTDKEYNWIVEFDRMGSTLTGQGKGWKNNDAVLYEYKGGKEFEDALKDCGFENLGTGSFTDISHLQELGVKAFNVAVGYHDNHSTKAYMFPKEYTRTINLFMEFYKKYAGHKFSHVPVTKPLYVHKTTYKQRPFDWNSYDAVGRTNDYVESGWIYDARFKPGDFVEYGPLHSDRVFMIDNAHRTKKNVLKYDVSHITGQPYLFNVGEHNLMLSTNTCYNCVMKTDLPLTVNDTDNSRIRLCPECYQSLIGYTIACDFCEDYFLMNELASAGAGYMICSVCAEEVFGNLEEDYVSEQPMLILPGDIVRHRKGGGKEYEVMSVDGGHQLFMLHVDDDGKETNFNNGGYGYDPLYFETIRRAR